MPLSEAFYSRSVADPQIAAIASQRLYPGAAPVSAVRPYAIYLLMARDGHYTMDGHTGLTNTTMRVLCVDNNHATAEALAQALRDLWDGYRGTYGDTVFDGVLCSSKTERYEPPMDASDVGRFVADIGFTVWHREPVPSLVL